MNIANQNIEGLPRDGVVFPGTELGGKPRLKESAAGNLGGDGDAQNHPGEPEPPSQNIQVSNGEDEGDGGGEGNGGSPWKLVWLEMYTYNRVIETEM